METAIQLTEAISTALWPIFAIVVVWKFYRPICALLVRASAFKLPGVEFTAQVEIVRAADDYESRIEPFKPLSPESDKLRVDLNKPAAMYFAGHDLMLAHYGLMAEGDLETVLWTLHCGIVNVERLGLKESNLYKDLVGVHQQLAQTKSSDLTTQVRRDAARKLWFNSRKLGSVVVRAEKTNAPN